MIGGWYVTIITHIYNYFEYLAEPYLRSWPLSGSRHTHSSVVKRRVILPSIAIHAQTPDGDDCDGEDDCDACGVLSSHSCQCVQTVHLWDTQLERIWANRNKRSQQAAPRLFCKRNEQNRRKPKFKQPLLFFLNFTILCCVFHSWQRCHWQPNLNNKKMKASTQVCVSADRIQTRVCVSLAFPSRNV